MNKNNAARFGKNLGFGVGKEIEDEVGLCRLRLSSYIYMSTLNLGSVLSYVFVVCSHSMNSSRRITSTQTLVRAEVEDFHLGLSLIRFVAHLTSSFYFTGMFITYLVICYVSINSDK